MLHATAGRPGAIAIIQLSGDCQAVLRALTGVADWPLHHLKLADLGGIDQGLAVRLTDSIAQIMPHGGPRILQRLTARLSDFGVELAAETDLDPMQAYPEATDEFEALMRMVLARAESPLAIDLLLDQPRRWRKFTSSSSHQLSDNDCERSQRLNHLIDPPVVVLSGQPNVGKSTLSNALLGRSMSITMDLPGTTRDYTAGRIDLAGLVVDWHDTPGIRAPSDAIEQRAIEVARRLVDRADLLIAMRDAGTDWPDLPREPDVFVLNKIDLTLHGGKTSGSRNEAREPGIDCGGTRKTPMSISARTGDNLAGLVGVVRERLVCSADLAHPGPWLFDPRLLTSICAKKHSRER